MERSASKVDLIVGDITTLRVEAIVNAANSALAGGGGVDGAIHAAGGPEIMEQTRRYRGCPTGEAVITGAGRLPATYVIHTVAPRYSGSPTDAVLLRSAYLTSLKLACEHAVKTIAFPSLGTGAYGYPIAEAAHVALRAVRDHLREATTLERITFVLFKEADRAVYEAAWESLR